ncbi:DUF3426 domain-containing protein [Atopomonas sediminilitoris]|uniref:DUF3426 domain-containing protein n=1 Tax=Atopomonas sediminilitoris TaxID=2919919 RepID=UPI001F4E6EE8|nr:DUF3426 domain-containing protein [Atopomonas sediminilitoris]MCJ8170168.1 DUF3426 domain-containing protein [Atopomonas sediminilitoris]
MNDTFITQCPHCQTSFRVKPAQLEVARGAVRCGACLKVFKAAQHRVGDLPTPAPASPSAAPTATPVATPTSTPAAARPAAASPAPAKPPTAPASHSSASNAPTPPKPPAPKPAAPATAAAKPSVNAPSSLSTSANTAVPSKPSRDTSALDDSLLIHDDLDLSDLDLDEEIAKLEAQEQAISQEFLNLSSAPPPAKQLLGDDVDSSDDDERWAEALLRAEEEQAKPSVGTTPSGLRQAPKVTVNDKPSTREAVQRLQVEQAQQVFASKAPSGVRKPAASLRAERDDAHDEVEEITLNAVPAASSAKQSTRSEPSLKSEALFDSLDDEPLQLDWRKPKRRWGRAIFWGLLNLTAAAALAGQYAWYNFESLARQDLWRPWLELACPHVGCSLPARIDPSLIKSSNLVVRSHPEFTGALVVDAILYNRADYAQPFPMLELRFADLNNQLLANRRFKPNEYLGGELAGAKSMPPQTPIHISLDILDPGTQAVNYSLSFSTPE